MSLFKSKQPKPESQPKPKKRFWTWRKIKLVLLLVLVAILVHRFPRGTGFWGLFGNATAVIPAVQEPQKTETQTASVVLAMSLSKDTLHLGKWQCSTTTHFQRSLAETIKKIRQEYPTARIVVEYQELGQDPHFFIQKTRDILSENGFIFQWKKQ